MKLETLLERNYQGIVDPECAHRVITYVTSHPSLEGYSARHIKKVTKVSYHIINSSHVEDRFVKHNYKYVREALRMDIDDKMRAHLEAYAGNFAKMLFDRTNQKTYCLRAYQHSFQAGERSERTEPRYAAYCFNDAAKAAFALHEAVDSVCWLERGYQAIIRSAQLTTNAIAQAKRYRRAYEAAKELARLTQDELWVEEERTCKRIMNELALQQAKQPKVKNTLRRGQEQHSSRFSGRLSSIDDLL